MNRTLEAAWYVQDSGTDIQLLRCAETNSELVGYPFYALRCVGEEIQQGVYGASQEQTQHIFKDWEQFERCAGSIQVR